MNVFLFTRGVNIFRLPDYTLCQTKISKLDNGSVTPCDLTVEVIYQRRKKKRKKVKKIKVKKVNNKTKHTPRISTSLQPHWVTSGLELKELRKE